MTKLYLGIDIGGTEVKVAIVNDNGKILEQKSFENSHAPNPKKVAQSIVFHSKQMENFKKVHSTGIGVAGDIDQKNGVVRFSPNLQWVNVHLKKFLSPYLPKPITIDNDANAAAWGAYWLEGKGKIKNFLCITLGTGVGGGIVCEGKLYRGTTGTAGEFGHMSYDPDGIKCACGNHGCIEKYVGVQALNTQAREGVKRGKSQILYKLVDGQFDAINPKIIEQAARIGDSFASDIWLTAGQRLGVLISSLINVFNPQMIVISGGISKAGELLLKPIKETVRHRAFRAPREACKIIISKYTYKLGVVGAALLRKVK